MKYDYQTMLENAQKSAHWSESKMWSSVAHIDDLLDFVKEHDEGKYWSFMRDTYGLLYDNHYADEDWAMWDVSCLSWTDKDGHKHTGAHWSITQVEDATKAMQFPSTVTRYDKFVAFNAAYSDWARSFDDSQILKIAYDFYFKDEDYAGADKIFQYMKMVHANKKS
jgi:hypothetical protein